MKMTGQSNGKQAEPERLTCRISFRMTESEYAQISEDLRISGLTVSALIRKRMLNQDVVARTDLLILSELRRLGGLLKHIHNETRGAYSGLTAQAIRDLSAYATVLTKKDNSSSKDIDM